MNIRNVINKIIHPNNYDSEAFVSFLRKKQIEIGNGCKFFAPAETTIDIQRPHLLHIGDYVKITKGVTILCHDFSRSVLCNIDGYQNCGECGETWIGNNVFIGVNTTVLMGAHIGDNCIVGANSVVSGRFEDGVVIAGNPAHKICSIDEYYKKLQSKQINNAVLFATKWKDKYGKYPTIYDMTNSFSWIYLQHNEETFKKYSTLFQLSGIDQEILKKNFLTSKSHFDSFESFLDYCDNNRDEQNTKF